MAVLELRTLTTGEPHYQMRVQLEGTDYLLTMRFGERRNAWVMDLETLDGVAILSGQLVTVGRDLLRRCAMAERPPGQLWALNVVIPPASEGGVLALPGLYDLGAGGRARLYYTESTTDAGAE
jgi:hypothetical protein